MNLKKMRLAAMVTTVLVSALTSASIFAAGNVKSVLTDEQFDKLATITTGDPNTFGKFADKSAVTGADGLDKFLGADAKIASQPRFKFVRMIEVKYNTADGKTTVAQVMQFQNNRFAEAYLVESVPLGAKFRAKGTGYRKDNMLVARTGSLVVRIKSGVGYKTAQALAGRYSKKITNKFAKIKHPAYRVLPPSNSVKLAAAAGMLDGSAKVLDKGRAPAEVEAINLAADYVSFRAGKPKHKTIVFVADYQKWLKRHTKAKMTNEQANVAKFVKNYVNRFRYFPVKSGNGYTIVGRYKGFVLGIHRLKGSSADPKRLKTILERTRIKLFFGKGSKAAAAGAAPAKGADADDADDEEAPAAETEGEDEESEEGGAASESDSEASDEE